MLSSRPGRDLSLTRFGWRDYDPLVGRFTAPDPLGDTGGDHDLYDYCVDDPVSKIDPSGLWNENLYDETRVKRGRTFDPTTNFNPNRFQPVDIYDEARPEIDGRPAIKQASAQGNSNEFRQKEYTFYEMLYSGLSTKTVVSSAENFITDLYEAVTNPIVTLTGIKNIVAGYACQLTGKDSEYRAYSDAVSEYFVSRWKNWDGFYRTLAEDPVGLAGDLSIILTGGTAAIRGLAKTSQIGGKIAKAASSGTKLSAGLAKGADELAGFAETGAKAAAKIDPVTLASKGLKPVAGILPQGFQESRYIAKAKKYVTKTGTPIARTQGAIKNITGVGGTVNAADRAAVEREEESKKKNKKP